MAALYKQVRAEGAPHRRDAVTIDGYTGRFSLLYDEAISLWDLLQYPRRGQHSRYRRQAGETSLLIRKATPVGSLGEKAQDEIIAKHGR